MEKYITVTGTGHIKTKPDMIRLIIHLAIRDMVYDKMMNMANEAMCELQECIGRAGFDKSRLKTTSYAINTEYDDKHTSDGKYTHEFAGYCCKHTLTFSFDMDMALLARLMMMLSRCKCSPEFSIHFTLKDPNCINEALLEDAARNAREKAAILTKAMNVRLGELLTINYSWSELRLESQLHFDCMMADQARFSESITPNDIEEKETVTFVWSIER